MRQERAKNEPKAENQKRIKGRKLLPKGIKEKKLDLPNKSPFTYFLLPIIYDL